MRYLFLCLSHLGIAVLAVFAGVKLGQVALVAPENQAIVGSVDNQITSLQAEPASQRAQPAFSDISTANTIFQKQLMAYRLAANSSTSDLQDYMQRLIGDEDPFLHYNLTTIFLERLIEIDVRSAISFVENARISRDRRQRFLADIVSSWVRHDPEAAIDYVAGIHDSQLKNIIGSRLLGDPTLAESGLRSELTQVMGKFGAQLSDAIQLQRTSPETLFEEALLLKGQARQQRLMSAFSRWFSEDPDTAIARLADITSLEERKNILRMMTSIRSQQDPLGALQLIRRLAPGDSQLEQQAISMLASRDIDQAIPYINEFVDRTGQAQLLSSVISNWARSDPLAAIAFAETVDRRHRQSVLHSLAFAYVSNYPEDGMRWASSVNEPQVLSAAISALARADLALAENWLDRFDDSQHVSTLLQNIAVRKAESDPQSAYDWLQGRTDKAGYQSALNSVFYQWARRDPEQAADLLERHHDDNSFQGAFTNTATHWANQDRPSAVAWMKSMPEGETRTAVTRQLVTQTFTVDRNEALDILADLSPALQKNIRYQLAHQWMSQSPDELETIINELSLDDNQADSLRAQFRAQ